MKTEEETPAATPTTARTPRDRAAMVFRRTIPEELLEKIRKRLEACHQDFTMKAIRELLNEHVSGCLDRLGDGPTVILPVPRDAFELYDRDELHEHLVRGLTTLLDRRREDVAKARATELLAQIEDPELLRKRLAELTD